jgi:hypothetical protein
MMSIARVNGRRKELAVDLIEEVLIGKGGLWMGSSWGQCICRLRI